MAKQTHVLFEMAAVVHVAIKGIPNPKGFPFIPDDQDVVGKFLKWQMEQDVHTVVHAGFSGGGGYSGFFHPDDADKIRAFLETLAKESK